MKQRWKYTTNVGPTKALIVESDGSTIVEVSNRTHDSRFLAHVRLMTAAPELLEQLKLARKCIAWCRAHHKDAQSNSGGLPVETLMDDVIARAEVPQMKQRRQAL